MNKNELSIEINIPPKELFYFLLDPQNTPKWIDGIIKEETNEWPIKLGSLYRNASSNGEVDSEVILNEYEVVELEEGKSFEFKQLNSTYHVKYVFEQTSRGTKLTYIEWVEQGEIENPFTIDILQKLKNVVEEIQLKD